ncbi:penicillin-insensitive murein endopeptidase, partial [Mesorhizobium sp. M8A.F.Ca.ET.207.01.1.1]
VAEQPLAEQAETISSSGAALPTQASAFPPTHSIGIPLPRPRPGN